MGRRKTVKKENGQFCGIIMPMSEINGVPASHWAEVKDIIQQSVQSVGYEAKIVSEADNANIFVSSIIQNLHDCPIVVCDVSCRNPNVMFELGVRLTFDKPTVIIVDDQTPFTSDIQGIKHLIYPRSLRHSTIEKFKEDLADTVKATFEESQKPEYRSFLKHYQKLKPSELETKEVSKMDYLISKIDDIERSLATIPSVVDDKYSLPGVQQLFSVAITNYMNQMLTLWEKTSNEFKRD